MNNKNIVKALTRAVNQAPSLDYDALIHMPYVKMSEHDFVTKQEEKPPIRLTKGYSIAFSFAVLLIAFFLGWFVPYRVPDSTITLDVNPSIEIITNRHDQVISVKALNLDGIPIIKERDSEKKDLKTTVSTLVSSIIRYGYLSTDKNVILVSVENRSREKADTLLSSLNQTIQDSALSHNVAVQVLRQTISKDKKEAKLAQSLNISVGKLKLIQEILSHNSSLSIEALASMSMEELLAITEGGNIVPSKTPQNIEDTSADISDQDSISDHEDNDRDDSDEEKDEDNASESEDQTDENEASESRYDDKDNHDIESRDPEDDSDYSKDQKDGEHNKTPKNDGSERKEDSNTNNHKDNEDDTSSEDNEDADHSTSYENDDESSEEDWDQSSDYMDDQSYPDSSDNETKEVEASSDLNDNYDIDTSDESNTWNNYSQEDD